MFTQVLRRPLLHRHHHHRILLHPTTSKASLPPVLGAKYFSSTKEKEGKSAFAPSLSESLSNETSFLRRLRLRLRFVLVGTQANRRWKGDDVAALFSWFSVAAILFAVAGTTSAVSLVVLGSDQEYLSNAISAYLSHLTGYEVHCDSAILPNWKEGTIHLANLHIVCNADTWRKRVLDQRREEAEGLNRSLARRVLGGLSLFLPKSWVTSSDPNRRKEGIEYNQNTDDVNVNWTYWDIRIKSVNVSLSLWRYLQGHGLVQACKLTGIRGVADRSHIIWPADWVPTRREATPYDFDMSDFVVQDVLVDIKNPNEFRPFSVSVYSARLERFRQQWLLYDVMCAESIVGAFDNCLFSVHKWKNEGTGGAADAIGDGNVAGAMANEGAGKDLGAEMSHLKINNLPIDHISTGVTGPFSWITSGTIDIDFHFLFPKSTPLPTDQLFAQIRQEFEGVKYIAMDKLEKIKERHHSNDPVTTKKTGTSDYQDEYQTALRQKIHQLTEPKTVTSPRTGTQYIETDAETEESKAIIETYSPREYPSRYTTTSPPPTEKLASQKPQINKSGAPQLLFMHWAISLNDLRASVPLSTPEIGYMSNALIRPIVGYMNAHRVRIPITFETRLPLENFNGSWDFFSAGVVDVVAEEIGRALTLLVLDERERTRQLKRIGLWSIQNATRGVMEVVDFVRGVEISQQSRGYM
ncbi:mitochondrial distribution and morphology protein family 31/32 [Rhizoclosmatium globosum]|uniref:Mitochondrial distribution and morphology protein family 31/32 n=1 Tax=Rhizoclosmatium globosum TaxID=329046 RepID=A0A1Y2CKC6_9FUNG|nr:mitochondrial distribution and morphology protein family 31/32 [Rhizoclosmatium globosum]|eukprot:ORY47450.1 mitochondrial distribution and morphology protein family 31/32 [Rhizoclosmatium globosum]